MNIKTLLERLKLDIRGLLKHLLKQQPEAETRFSFTLVEDPINIDWYPDDPFAGVFDTIFIPIQIDPMRKRPPFECREISIGEGFPPDFYEEVEKFNRGEQSKLMLGFGEPYGVWSLDELRGSDDT